MENLNTTLLVVIATYIVVETVAAIVLYKRRATYVPALRQMIGRFIGTSDIAKKLKRIEEKLDNLENN